MVFRFIPPNSAVCPEPPPTNSGSRADVPHQKACKSVHGPRAGHRKRAVGTDILVGVKRTNLSQARARAPFLATFQFAYLPCFIFLTILRERLQFSAAVCAERLPVV